MWLHHARMSKYSYFITNKNILKAIAETFGILAIAIFLTPGHRKNLLWGPKTGSPCDLKSKWVGENYQGGPQVHFFNLSLAIKGHNQKTARVKKKKLRI